jgi:hypothetical protein
VQTLPCSEFRVHAVRGPKKKRPAEAGTPNPAFARERAFLVLSVCEKLTFSATFDIFSEPAYFRLGARLPWSAV